MRTYIFACVHNAGRSQMSAALFNQLADSGQAKALSAGTHPAERVHPAVVDVMNEIGINLSTTRPQKLTAEMAEGAELLITMGCGDQCPYVRGLRRADWPLTDPKGLPIEDVRVIRDDIRSRVQVLLAGEGITPAARISDPRSTASLADSYRLIRDVPSEKPFGPQRPCLG